MATSGVRVLLTVQDKVLRAGGVSKLVLCDPLTSCNKLLGWPPPLLILALPYFGNKNRSNVTRACRAKGATWLTPNVNNESHNAPPT